MFKRHVVLFFLLTGAFVFARADVPGPINFQGALTDENGLPVNGSKTFVFRIYDDAAASTNLLWSETQALAVSTGVFSAKLGSVTPIGAAVFDATPRYLEIEVEGSVLTPREQITSSAYAKTAQKSYTLTEGASVNVVNISTASITGARLYLTGGEGTNNRVFVLERKRENESRGLLRLTFRITGIDGSEDPLIFENRKAYFYKDLTGARLEMGGNMISNVTISSMSATTIFYPPTGASLPTGIAPGGVYYNSSNFTLYLATETTAGTQSWSILGGAGH